MKVFSGLTGAEIRSFFSFPGSLAASRSCGGDIDRDGFDDIVVGAGPGGNGHVKVFEAVTGAELRSFFVFAGYNGGVNVAAGDLDGDGFAEVIVASDAAESHVEAFDGASQALVRQFPRVPRILRRCSRRCNRPRWRRSRGCFGRRRGRRRTARGGVPGSDAGRT